MFFFVQYIKNECREFKRYKSVTTTTHSLLSRRCLVFLPLLETFKSFDIWKRNTDHMLMRFITNVCLMRTCDTLANDPIKARHQSSDETEECPAIPLYWVPTPWPSPGQCHVSRGQAPGPGIITISGDVTQSRPRPRLPIMCPSCPAGYSVECVGNIESRWRNKPRIDRL